jgi:3-oxoacyl-[acyl-carrier protein] reductase
MPKIALITGGSRGLGAAIGAELAAQGCRVVAPPRAELDLASAASVSAYLQANAKLEPDILINNAGVNFLNPIPAVELATWQLMLQTNLTSALQLIQAFAPGMARRGWGRILNISSVLGVVAREKRAAYSMTKAALNALTRTAAVEFGPAGVLANALAPGYVDTELTRQNNTPEMLAAITAAVPLRRLAQPAELAKVAAFLVSENNSYLTGQTVIVDGGFTCQ